MRKMYLFGFAFAGLLLFSFKGKNKKQPSVKKAVVNSLMSASKPKAEGPKYQSSLQMNREEFERLVDPATHTVPSERLATVYEQLIAEETESPLPTPDELIQNITWTEKGPTNVGGRTRSLMVDPNDPSKKTVWASSVGGGIWKNTNVATSPWIKINDNFDAMAVTTLAYNPANTLQFYFGTGEGFNNADAQRGGGIWESLDGGNTWTRLASTANNPNFYFVNKIVVAPNGDAYAGTSTGLYKRTGGTGSFVKVLTGKAAVDNISAHFSDVEIGLTGGGNYNIYAVATTKYFTGLADGTFFHSTNGGPWVASDYNTPADVLSFEYTTDNAYPGGVYPGVNRIEIACKGDTVYALCQQHYLGDAVPDNIDSVLILPIGPPAPPAGYTGLGAKCIIQSLNGGVSWTQKVLPANTEASTSPTSPNDFTRGQCWYDISLQVDPNDANTIYAGAIDYWKSSAGGTGAWTQLTDWQGLKPIPEMHSDHHTLIFEPGNSAIAYLGGDGGVYMGTNMNNSALYNILPKNTNYNVTQFYAAATRKEAGSNYFLAGAQDNGSQQFTAPGTVSTFEVSGGDGAVCLIDQINSNNQITSYVYNNFYRSTSGASGVTFSTVSGGANDGRFINPCDLSTGRGVLYSAGNADSIYRWKTIFGTVAKTVIDMDALNPAANSDRKPTALTVSPNDGTMVYVGDSRGRLYRIRNAENAPVIEPIANPAWESATGGFFYISSIDIFPGTGTDDMILITGSNYGVNSVWMTRNGSTATPTWTSIEGNLPDMPVRWAVFDPRSSNAAFLGTELGMFSSDNLAGSATIWERHTNFPNIKVDMIKVRQSDKTLVVATHGRGLWISNPLINVILANDLVSFDAIRTPKAVDVKWSIQDENNMKKYEVERSYEGLPYEPAVISRNAYNNGAVSNYAATDEAVSFTKGNIYYRLKMTAADGSIKFSNIIRIKGDKNALFVKNIFMQGSNSLIIETDGMDVKEMWVNVYMADGKELFRQKYQYGNQQINMAMFPAGSYFIKVSDANNKFQYIKQVSK